MLRIIVAVLVIFELERRLPACMWRRVSLAAQIRSFERQLLSLWRLRTVQYLMELAQPFVARQYSTGQSGMEVEIQWCSEDSIGSIAQQHNF